MEIEDLLAVSLWRSVHNRALICRDDSDRGMG